MLPVYMPMHFIHLHAHSFASPNGFYSVYRCICFPSVHSLQAPTVFILFTTRCILYAQFVGLPGFYSVYRRICFSEWHIVPQLYIQKKQSRTRSRKALYECKASRRLGKQIRCFIGFCLKPTMQHPHYLYF